MSEERLTLLARAVIRRVGARDEVERRAWVEWVRHELGEPVAPAPLTWSMRLPEEIRQRAGEQSLAK